MYTPQMVSSLVVARLLNWKAVLIVPDLVDYMRTEKFGRIENLLRKVNSAIAYALAARFDGFVLFTKGMRDKLRISGKPSIVVEGCIDADKYLDDTPRSPRIVDKPYFMYSGALRSRYGIKVLIEAFKMLEDFDCRLVITGSGPDAGYLEEVSSKNPRIMYAGLLSTPEDVKKLQMQAIALINPRQGGEEYTHYCYPSKNMEYMASGRPTVVCSMNGIPEEYSRYLKVVKEDGASALAAMMKAILMEPEMELAAFGANAREFVLQNKNHIEQGKKIYDFGSSLF
jgi:glycosyltransferase involved in cell wall biosynthesis